MAARIWPAFFYEPEYQREREDEEWDRQAQEWEDQDLHRENVRLGFEEDAA